MCTCSVCVIKLHAYVALLLLCDNVFLGVLHCCFYCLCVLFIVDDIRKQFGNLRNIVPI